MALLLLVRTDVVPVCRAALRRDHRRLAYLPALERHRLARQRGRAPQQETFALGGKPVRTRACRAVHPLAAVLLWHGSHRQPLADVRCRDLPRRGRILLLPLVGRAPRLDRMRRNLHGGSRRHRLGRLRLVFVHDASSGRARTRLRRSPAAHLRPGLGARRFTSARCQDPQTSSSAQARRPQHRHSERCLGHREPSVLLPADHHPVYQSAWRRMVLRLRRRIWNACYHHRRSCGERAFEG